jgi:probable HAF family extracellular repeat protein
MNTGSYRFLCLLVACCWVFVNNSAHGQLQYTLIDLGSVGGISTSSASGLNNIGNVIGSTSTASSYGDAFLYTSGSMTDLGSFGRQSTAYGINDSQQVVGLAQTSSGAGHGFLYSGGTMTDLTTLGLGIPHDINNSGVIVGDGTNSHAYLYSGGNKVDLGTLGGVSSSAQSVNDLGEAVGSSNLYVNGAQVTHAFLYSAGHMTDLGTLGGNGSSAAAINDFGQIAGSSLNSSGITDAFLYSNGKMQDLGNLGKSNASTYAYGINNAGQIVGSSYTANNTQRPFIYTNGVMYDLTNLVKPGGMSDFAFLWDAKAINNRGEIVGMGYTSSVARAYLAEPTLATATTTRQPSAALTTKQSVSNTQLEVFNGSVFASYSSIDTTKPTIVLTHGWDSTPEMWVNFAKAISSKSNVNIVAWNWASDADTGPGGAGEAESRTLNQGDGLGQTLGSLLGSNYTQSIQFFGHSLGTLVNAQAINVLHSMVGRATIQDTLFDDAELSNVIGTSGLQWASSIPKSGDAALIDNYISSVGNPHPEATNFVLDKPFGMNYGDFHGYPVSWYQPTISGTTVGGSGAPSNAGFSISVINDPSVLTTGSFAGTYYEGGTDGSVHQIDALTANTLVGIRRADELTEISQLTATIVNAAVQTEGHVNVSLGAGLGVAVQLIKHSPSYAWLPITIPAGAETMLADFQFSNLSSGDWLSIGINNTQLFALEDQFAGDGQQDTTTALDVSQWAGQNVELFLGLNNVDDNDAGGSITVSNVRFEGVPEPSTWALVFVGTGALALKRRLRKA